MATRVLLLTIFALAAEGATECETRHASLERKYQNALRQLEEVRRERDALLELLAFPNGRPDGEPQAEHLGTVLGDPAIAAVRPSGIKGAGRGAFALRDFEPGAVVGRYKCSVLPREKIGDGTRAWAFNDTHGCDGSLFPLNNPLRYVNSIISGDNCAMQNVAYEFTPPDSIVYVAQKPISAGDEILVDYTKQFFLYYGLVYTCNMPVLHSASAKGDIESVRQSLVGSAAKDSETGGEDINEVAGGWTALQEATHNGHSPIVDLLVKQGADLDAGSEEMRSTILHLACNKGHVSVLWALLEARAAIDKANPADGSSPLLSAAGLESGHLDIVTALLHARADKNAASADGATPLSVASRNGYTNIVGALLVAGADVGGKGEDYEIPLFAAAESGHDNVLRMLLHARALADVARIKDGATPLFIASRMGRSSVCRVLLGVNASKDRATRSGTTPLFIAAQYGHIDVVNLLLAANVDTNKACSGDATPLHVSAEEGHGAVVRALLKARAGIDLVTSEGATPLILAAQSGHADQSRSLLGSGANAQRKTRKGVTPLLVACASGHEQVVKALLQHGVDSSVAANGGYDLAALAKSKGHSAVANWLMKRDEL